MNYNLNSNLDNKIMTWKEICELHFPGDGGVYSTNDLRTLGTLRKLYEKKEKNIFILGEMKLLKFNYEPFKKIQELCCKYYFQD